MSTYHLHFKGVVQGVGFRPFVLDSARSRGLSGRVKNSGKGLEIVITADEAEARSYFDYLFEHAPLHSLITSRSIRKVADQKYKDFQIEESSTEKKSGALLSPDIALCDRCRDEMRNKKNRRYKYAFATCLNCGPRYSIIRKLPYDRPHTTMADLKMCSDCKAEYEEPGDIRQHSQTNSCPQCSIPMILYDSNKKLMERNPKKILRICAQSLKEGHIWAVKGVGGYLLLADATREKSIQTLRIRKKRPSKPFAVMYPNLKVVKEDAWINPYEEKELKRADAPVLLALRKKEPASGLCSADVAPGLQTIGILLPYSPLFELILSEVSRPLVATSANLSGSTIIYDDQQALDHLGSIADYILTFDREIVTPQDDSVVQINQNGDRILLRRSRGLSPNYHPHPFRKLNKRVLATGADLKGAFAIADREKLIVSQYLGDQESYDSQLAFQHTLDHIQTLYSFKPEVILSDQHPVYHSRALAEKVAKKESVKLFSIQHHEAHFAAVLAENGLLKTDREVLGFIWDGTGYGDDGQVWGGETFSIDRGGFKRKLHLDYFPVLAGDKMSLEPRLSALSLFAQFPEAEPILQSLFNEKEWDYYQKLLAAPTFLKTSSMGRFIDAIAAILGISSLNSYEAEAAIKLESIVRTGISSGPGIYEESTDSGNYSFEIFDDIINWKPVLSEILEDIGKKKSTETIVKNLFGSLGKLVFQSSRQAGVKDLAFSGGVFQNVVLVNTLLNLKPEDTRLWFHKKLSPNDENIPFGQIAYYEKFLK